MITLSLDLNFVVQIGLFVYSYQNVFTLLLLQICVLFQLLVKFF